MRFSTRVNRCNKREVKFTLFSDGIHCGNLIMSRDQYRAFSEVLTSYKGPFPVRSSCENLTDETKDGHPALLDQRESTGQPGDDAEQLEGNGDNQSPNRPSSENSGADFGRIGEDRTGIVAATPGGNIFAFLKPASGKESAGGSERPVGGAEGGTEGAPPSGRPPELDGI